MRIVQFAKVGTIFRRAGLDVRWMLINVTGIRMVLRNSLGGFVAARVVYIPKCWRVEDCEAMKIHEALYRIKAPWVTTN